MKSLALLAWIVSIVALGATLALLAPRAAQARSDARREVGRFHQVARLSAELAEFRKQENTATLGSSEPTKLAPAATSALAATGLAPTTLTSLSPQPPSVERLGADAASMRLVRHRGTMVLAPLTLAQFGRFLAQWRSAAPDWTVARIDLEPLRGDKAPPGSDLPIRATIVVESVRVDTGGNGGRP